MLPLSTVFAELQGTTLTIIEVFITLCSTLLTICQHSPTDVVSVFTVSEVNTSTRLDYLDPEPPRSSPTLFAYQYASRARRLIAIYIFQKGKVEDERDSCRNRHAVEGRDWPARNIR